MNPLKQTTVGGHIESQCTKCGRVTNHTIVAMVEEQVVKVQCNTCEGMHKHRPPKAPKTAKAKSASTPRRVTDKSREKARSADQEQWEQEVRDKNSEDASPYDMQGDYTVDELVRHPIFGLGVVTATFKPNKMEVLFEDGRKTLRCQL